MHRRTQYGSEFQRDETRCGEGRVFLRRFAVSMGTCCLLLAAPPCAKPQSEGSAEYAVKLAFLYNFAKFVDWPPDAFPDARAPFEICVVGQDPFGDQLAISLRGRAVGGHPATLQRVKPGEYLRHCHIVFVSGHSRKDVATVLNGLRGTSALTVGESNGFAANGGVINFFVEENKLRFEINVEAARRTGLNVSSKLLALAKIVKSQENTGVLVSAHSGEGSGRPAPMTKE
jgi:YfiR/HmsC-like